MVAMSVTVSSGPQTIGVYGSVMSPLSALLLGQVLGVLSVLLLGKILGVMSRRRELSFFQSLSPTFLQDNLGPPAETMARSTQPNFMKTGSWK
jgi:hypothetical protein